LGEPNQIIGNRGSTVKKKKKNGRKKCGKCLTRYPDKDRAHRKKGTEQEMEKTRLC